mmetsp:Transcript_4886/g.11882  ORF Transcript_4886/g.11882 Transcript_4886/m.11882 type:complete len:223 (-) Transcript_4886:31-699(-)
MKTMLPTYCTMHPDDFASFFLVLPWEPMAYESSSWFNSMVAVPQSPVKSDLLSNVAPFLCHRSVKYPGTLVSTTPRTESCAPRRPARSPKMRSSISSSRNSTPSRSAKHMIVPYSSSSVRRKLPPLPVTKPTASCGIFWTVQLSAVSSSVTTTAPVRWAMTHRTYFMARLRCLLVPVNSSLGPSSRSSMSHFDTRAIFNLVRPPLPRTQAASSSVISSISES